MSQAPTTSRQITIFRERIIKKLLAERDESGSWEGELSSSALATAVATIALYHYSSAEFMANINSALDWLSTNINSDGGYGDTSSSPSNISTTLLCWSVFSLSNKLDRDDSTAIRNIEQWLTRQTGAITPDKIRQHILAIYHDDHTFSVPILTTLAISGRLGDKPWGHVLQLPFELAVFPAKLFKFLKLQVVSYALPALIAIGLVRHKKKKLWYNPLSWLRSLLTKQALKKLAFIQPSNGGFLEAIPLTAFVLMSLCESGLKDTTVAKKCASFLKSSIRKNGSYPIDTHLRTWVTTLSINALTESEKSFLNSREKITLKKFLIDQQHKELHPYTATAAGGWAWSPLPGAVPDADDTAGALIALKRLSQDGSAPLKEVENGISWLLKLQNNDGGIPTFCRGWGRLPFDQSCPDITAHCLRALYEWRQHVSSSLQIQIDTSAKRLVAYLKKAQRPDGAWNPLWFGNQHNKEKHNLTYGTAQVIITLSKLSQSASPELESIYQSSLNWLKQAQNEDGSWSGARGGPGSIEETSLAINALLSTGLNDRQVDKGFAWLIKESKNGTDFQASPIGLYFANLWYDEKIYPLVYTVAAVEKYFKMTTQKS